MSFRSTVPVLLAALAAVSLVPSARAEGNAERGRKLAYTCYGCHGIPNYKNVYPTYDVPKLEGQHAAYLKAALQAYKSGERSHTTMHAQAASLSEQDMEDIAVFLSGQEIKMQPGEKPTPPQAAQLCVSCHGADGVGIMPEYPTLAGQHRDYLERAVLDYKSGARKNPIMAGLVAQLKDEDIKEAAEYFSKLKPSLSTAKHANWFGQEKKPAAAEPGRR